MGKLSFILSTLLIGSIGYLQAQECGKVIDRYTNNPLAGVHIYANSSEPVAVTDSDGKFCLPESAKSDTLLVLSFSHISYKKRTMTYEEFRTMKSLVRLAPSSQNLSEVVISAVQPQLQYQLQHRTLAPMKNTIQNFGATLVGNYIYVTGGLENNSFHNTRVYRYHIPTDKWETLSQKTQKRSNHAVLYHNDKLFMIGGLRYSTNHKKVYLENTIDIYDLNQDTVLIDPVNPHHVTHMAFSLFEEHIILLGGTEKKSLSGKRFHTDKVHAFDLKRGFWYEMPSLPLPMESTGICIGNKFYLAGGRVQDMISDKIYSYDLQQGTLEEESLMTDRFSYPALAANGPLLYIFQKDILQVYNVETKASQVYQTEIYLQYCQMFYADNKLYILGGFYGEEEFPNIPPVSRGLYCIELSQFEQTMQHYSKK